MSNSDWLISLQNSADAVSSAGHGDTVKFILGKRGVSCIEDLDPCYYEEVFSELYAVEADLKN